MNKTTLLNYSQTVESEHKKKWIKQVGSLFCQTKLAVLQSAFDHHGNDLIKTVLQLGLHGSPTPSNRHTNYMKTLALTNQLKRFAKPEVIVEEKKLFKWKQYSGQGHARRQYWRPLNTVFFDNT